MYNDATRLSLGTGNDVEAFVRIHAGSLDRPRCLLLHGNPGSLLDWERFVPRLSEVADVAAIDIPGFGKSRRTGSTPESLSLDRLAEQAVAVLDALAWRGPVYLLGHSHGGGVAQTVAARYPDRVAGLVLIATIGMPAPGAHRFLSLPGAAAVARVVGRMLRVKFLRPMIRAILRWVMLDIFSPDQLSGTRLDREFAALVARPEVLVSMVHVTLGRPCAQLFELAPAIRCPALFVHGTRDAVVPAKCARCIHERIVAAGGDSQFQLLPGAGHMLMDYQATDLANVIRPWLVTRRPRGAVQPEPLSTPPSASATPRIAVRSAS